MALGDQSNERQHTWLRWLSILLAAVLLVAAIVKRWQRKRLAERLPRPRPPALPPIPLTLEGLTEADLERIVDRVLRILLVVVAFITALLLFKYLNIETPVPDTVPPESVQSAGVAVGRSSSGEEAKEQESSSLIEAEVPRPNLFRRTLTGEADCPPSGTRA